jgi:hypothetical protein
MHVAKKQQLQKDVDNIENIGNNLSHALIEVCSKPKSLEAL